ncbi:MAG: class I SAM-dependent methyltransferase [Candidatus Aminicenantales bacterium]
MNHIESYQEGIHSRIAAMRREPPATPFANAAKIRFFDERASRWDRDHACPAEDSLIPLIVPFFRLERGLRVLDLGCGTGKLVPRFLEGVGRSGSVVEADFSCEMLKACRGKKFGANVHFVRMDGQGPAFRNGTFDRLVCFSLFPHIDDQPAALGAFRRLLAPGSPLIIAHTMGREELNAHFIKVGGPVGEDRLPANDAMRVMLADAGFRNPEIVDRPHHYIARAWK